MSGPLALVVITYGRQHLGRRLLDTLRDHPDRALIAEAVVVDNGFPAMGDSSALIDPAAYPFPVRFVQNTGSSYAQGINLGAAASSAPFIAVSNSDVEWLPGQSLAPIISYLREHHDAGIAGPQQVFPDGSWQRSYGPFPSLREGAAALLMSEVVRNGLAARRHASGAGVGAPRDVDYIDGAFFVVRRSCFEALGGMDAGFEFYAEDVDLSWRAARAGWRRVHVPEARIMHIRGASSKAVASIAYIHRLFAAKARFLRQSAGPAHARIYDVMQRMVACEYAAIYSVIARLRPTPAWKRRASMAVSAARAVLGGS